MGGKGQGSGQGPRCGFIISPDVDLPADMRQNWMGQNEATRWFGKGGAQR